MADELPYFKFFAKDWLGDFNVRTMSPAERGIYADLLAFDWAEGGIPDDPERLARAVGVDADAMRNAWDTLADRFIPHPTKQGRVTNRRLAKERREIHAAAEKRSQAARKAANARWKQEKKSDGGATRNADASETQCDSMPSRSREKSESESESTSSSSSLRSDSSDGASPDVENSGEGGKSDDPPPDDEEEFGWPDLAGWMRTEGCPSYLWGQQDPPSEDWSDRRDIDICRELVDQGEDPWIVREVVRTVPELPNVVLPVTMRLFWASGKRQTWNEAKGRVQKRLERETVSTSSGPTRLEVSVEERPGAA